MKLIREKAKTRREYIESKTGTDLHESDRVHLKNAEQAFLEIAQLFPNTKLIECVERNAILPPAVIHNTVWELVRRIVFKNSIQGATE